MPQADESPLDNLITVVPVSQNFDHQYQKLSGISKTFKRLVEDTAYAYAALIKERTGSDINHETLCKVFAAFADPQIPAETVFEQSGEYPGDNRIMYAAFQNGVCVGTIQVSDFDTRARPNSAAVSGIYNQARVFNGRFGAAFSGLAMVQNHVFDPELPQNGAALLHTAFTQGPHLNKTCILETIPAGGDEDRERITERGGFIVYESAAVSGVEPTWFVVSRREDLVGFENAQIINAGLKVIVPEFTV